MYLMGQGHEHLGPGTSMSQRINWTTAQEMQDNPGMGCFGCHGVTGLGCFGCHGVSGFGYPDGFGADIDPDDGIVFQEMNGAPCKGGLGLFDSGFDPSTFGWGEWTAIVLGAYTIGSLIFTTGRGYKRVRALPGERRKRRAARLRKEASELTRTR